MFGIIAQRSFHIGKATMAITKSSVLARLRKSTGYSVSNCKKALEMFPDDIQKAEEWLHSEAKSKGWAKWAKIQSRTAAQGLVGVYSRDNVGVMVEVNCETDFVSRNSEFQEYVARMLSGCLNFAVNLNTEGDVSKKVLEEAQLSSVKCESSTLGELLIAASCKFNEKTVAKRAVCFKVKDGIFLNGLSHPSYACQNLNGASLGKYGVLLASKKRDSAVTEEISPMALNICQHIIGMNPLSIGQLTDEDVAKFSGKQDDSSESTHEENVQSLQANTQLEKEETDDTEDQEEVETALKDSDETQLLFQPYLLDQNVTVGETLFKSGLEVVEFERFECGEKLEELEVAQSASG